MLFLEFRFTELSQEPLSLPRMDQFVGVQSSARQTRPVKSFICLVKDAVWHAAQFIVLSHTSDNWRLFEISSAAAAPRPGHDVQTEIRGDGLMLIFPAFFCPL